MGLSRLISDRVNAIHTHCHTLITNLATVSGYNGWKCLEKSDGSIPANTTDDLFTIAGGPIYARVFGIVTTVIGATAANGTLRMTTTLPSATVTISTAVSIASAAAGSLISFNTVAAGTVPVLTITANGIGWFDPATATMLSEEFFLPPGTMKFHSTATNTGNIKWYLSYLPLSTNTVVTVAA
jgi:hypothetical protein